MLAFAMTTSSLQLPPDLLSAICYVETKHVVSSIHKNDGGSDSLGICQVKLTTAKDLGFKGTAYELQHNNNVNIHYAGKYLQKQLRKYAEINKSISAFNAGHYTPKNYKYVNKVNNAWGVTYARH